MQYLRRVKYISDTQSGFTLIEIIMVIVVLGLLGIGGGEFIAQVFKGFRATNNRLEIYEEGKAALARMERELHNMLPNGICVTNNRGGSCESGSVSGNEIRFGMIAEDVMRLRNLSGGYEEQAIDFPLAAPAKLTEINSGFTPSPGSVVSIYNTNWNSFASGSKLFTVSSVSGSEMTFGGQSVVDPSPHRRYFVLDRGVSYRWSRATNTLYRSVVTVTGAGPGNFSRATEYPLAQNVSDFRFYYSAPSLARNGIISIVFTMAKDDDSVVIHKEIHVKNVP